MEKFDVHILGCGSAIPTLKHFPTAQVLDIRDKLFMIDCAEGTQLLLRKQKLKFSRLNHIFISHLHGDHCFGLIGLLSTFDLLGRTSKLHLYSPGEDLERLLRPQIEYFCRGMGYEVVFHAVPHKEATIIYEDRTLTVETIPLKHRIPCCGYLFREKAALPHIRKDMIDYLQIPSFAINSIKEGAGWIDENGREWEHEKLVFPAEPARSYAYCSDTIFRPQLVEQLKSVDLLYHEATFTEECAKRAKETYHSTAKQAASIAKDANVGRLVIGHFSARYEDEQVFLTEAQEVFVNTLLAKDGLKISI